MVYVMINLNELAQKRLESEANLAIASLFMNRDCLNLHEPALRQSIIFLSPQTEKSYQDFLITTPETLFWYQNGVMKTLGIRTNPTSPFAEVTNITCAETAKLFNAKVGKMFESLLKHLECLKVRYDILENENKRLSKLVYPTPKKEQDNPMYYSKQQGHDNQLNL